MRPLLFPLFALIPAASVADDFYSSFPVTAATVFDRGALVELQASVAVPQGRHDIYVPLSPSMTLNASPRFSVSGATPISVSIINGLPNVVDVFLTPTQRDAQNKVNTLQTQIAELDAAQSRMKGERDGLQAQFNYLQNITPKGQDTVQSVDEIQSILGLLPQAFADNRAASGALDLKQKQAREDMAALQDKLRLAQTALKNLGLPQANWTVARITVSKNTPGDVTVFSDTFVAEAQWQIRYDARLDEDKGKITLNRRALVSQYTGTAWTAIDLTLSSAEPFQRLNPQIPGRDVVQLVEVYKKLSPAPTSRLQLGDQAPVLAEVFAASPVASGNFNGIAVTYTIAEPTTISGAGAGAEQINLAALELDADVDRFANARYDETAFVRAKTRNTTGEPILPGRTIFYRGDTLIGQSQLAAMAPGAKQTLFFGPDDTLPITMRFLEEMTGDTGVFTRSNTRTERMAFSVENIGSVAKDVTLTYALPITVNEEVQVTTAARPAPDHRDVEGVKGRSEWAMTLEAGQSQKVDLDVEITWPEGKQINWRP